MPYCLGFYQKKVPSIKTLPTPFSGPVLTSVSSGQFKSNLGFLMTRFCVLDPTFYTMGVNTCPKKGVGRVFSLGTFL